MTDKTAVGPAALQCLLELVYDKLLATMVLDRETDDPGLKQSSTTAT